jgi:hypothetical protein
MGHHIHDKAVGDMPDSRALIELAVVRGPDEGIDIVRKHAPIAIGREVIESLPGDPEIADPWPVYVQNVRALADRKLIEGALLAAWQYPIFVGETLVSITEVNANPPRFAAQRPQQYAQQVLAAIDTARSKSPIPFELRLLQSPGASLYLVWIHGRDDYFVPIQLVPTVPLERIVMTANEVVNAIAPILPERLKAIHEEGA